MASFKLFFGPDSIRRFRTDVVPNYDGFVSLLSRLYPTAFHPELKLTYLDSDGDKCTVSTQPEWEEMLEECKAQTVFRIWVSEGEHPYFKDGPEPEVVDLYTPSDRQSVEKTQWAGIPDRVIQALENLFPCGKILPLCFPSFLQPLIKLRTLDNSTVDITVDIASLNFALHKEAYRLLTSDSTTSQLAEARTYLVSQIILDPTNDNAYYNLACAESLLKNHPPALIALRKAVECGFHNKAHIEQDTDLDNIRSLPEFSDIVNSIPLPTSTITTEEVLQPVLREAVPEPQPEPEPIPQPVVQEQPKEEKPEEQPEKEEAPVSDWETELALFAEMGFLNRSILIQTLEKTGDVSSALAELLG